MAHSLLLFYPLAALAVFSTLLMITRTNPIYSVLLLIASFVPLAGLYLLLDAPVIALTQIIVYAGALMALFLFGVMVLDVPLGEVESEGAVAGSGTARWFGVLLAMVMALELVWGLNRSRAVASQAGGERETVEYAVAIGVTSVLFLVAMAGAMALAGRHQAEDKPWLS